MSTLVFSSNPARLRMEAAGRRYGNAYNARGLRAIQLAREARRRRLLAKMEARLFGTTLAGEKPATMISTIVDEVCTRYRMDPEQLLTDRSRPVARIRHEAYWICRIQGRRSLPEIGRFFHKDHSTVMHGVTEHARRMLEAEIGT